MDQELPVFDRRDALPAILNNDCEWQPAPMRLKARGVTVKLSNDGPEIDWRLSAQAARLTSNGYSGQAVNDNEDWPLAKLLRTEKNEFCLSLAKKYRSLHSVASMPTQLVGKEADNLYVVHKHDQDGKAKEVKVIFGRKANVETAPCRATVASDHTKKRAAPIAKKWNGDEPLLAQIDAARELAYLRGKLSFVPKILDAFEWAVVDGLTLEAIGIKLGAGKKGAKGEARARIFDGFEIADRWWQGQRRLAA